MIPLTPNCNSKKISSGRHADSAHRRAKRRYPVRHSVVLILWAWLFIFVALTVRAEAAPSTPLTDLSAIEEKWGVQIVGLRQTAAGQMLDFRYRVVDAEKAAPLFDRKTQPYLFDKVSGKSLAVPNMAKIGALRTSSMPQTGRTYWMFFGNPGVVKPGAKVSVVIGEFRAEDILVR
jgi:hypothetical protein